MTPKNIRKFPALHAVEPTSAVKNDGAQAKIGRCSLLAIELLSDEGHRVRLMIDPADVRISAANDAHDTNATNTIDANDTNATNTTTNANASDDGADVEIDFRRELEIDLAAEPSLIVESWPAPPAFFRRAA